MFFCVQSTALMVLDVLISWFEEHELVPQLVSYLDFLVIYFTAYLKCELFLVHKLLQNDLKIHKWY